MKLFKRLPLLITAVLSVLTAGCIPSELYLKVDMSEPGTDLKIAAVLPLSGRNKIAAEQMAEGMKMAEYELNANSVTGRGQLQLKFFDSKGSADGAMEAVEAAAKWGAAGIIAGYSTEEVSDILPHAVRHKMPVVIPLATSNEHTDLSPFVFRNSYTDRQQSEVLANYLLHWRQAKTLGIFLDESKDVVYQNNIARDTAQAFQDIGGKVTATLLTKQIPEEKDIVALLKTDPEAILVTFGGKEAGILIRKLREAGFTGIICGPDSWDTDELVMPLQNIKVGECLYTAFFNAENESQEFKKFKKEFRKRFYYYPGARETQSYDALKFMVVGFYRAETLLDFDRNWRSIQQHQGAAARYTMLPRGDIDRTIYINTIGVRRNGKGLEAFSRFSRQIQYSRIKMYNPDYYK